MADFVKGDPYNTYSADIADGIMMHRRVDKLTDTLPLVKEARQLFSLQHYRVAPIALDIVWDHFLALRWPEFEPKQTLAVFTEFAENQISPQLWNTPVDFQRINRFIWQEHWLENYADLAFIAKVLQGMANRRPRLVLLATSIGDIRKNYDELNDIFGRFYPQMLEQARAQVL
jgi:acyl carrier protein phosphodiesterase